MASRCEVYGIIGTEMRFSENDLSAQCDTILCLDTESEELPSQRRIFDGIKRYSKARGWHLKILPRDKTLPERMPSMLRSPEIAGCIVFDFRSDGFFPPAVFGSLPVVYFDSSSLFRWRGRVSVVCDNVAVARAAFRDGDGADRGRDHAHGRGGRREVLQVDEEWRGRRRRDGRNLRGRVAQGRLQHPGHLRLHRDLRCLRRRNRGRTSHLQRIQYPVRLCDSIALKNLGALGTLGILGALGTLESLETLEIP